jgi:non-heme chloroperoxidase
MTFRRNKSLPLLLVALCGVFGLFLAWMPAFAGSQDGTKTPRRAESLKLQDEFDYIGTPIQKLVQNGRTSYYFDVNPEGAHPVVYLGGGNTSLEAFQLTEFTRTMRDELGVREISVERNGLGASQLDTSLGYTDYNNEVFGVLDHLGVDRFSIVAISGGGPYAAHLAAAAGDRVISMHLAVASASALPNRTPPNCTPAGFEALDASNLYWKTHPMEWWGVSADAEVQKVPGWQETAYLDGVRAFFMGGQLDDVTALSMARRLQCGPDGVVDPSQITAPTYLYWGGSDTTVPVTQMEKWEEALPNDVRSTVYPGEGHTVQYRHWDQILTDIAGYSDYTVLCVNGDTKLVSNARAPSVIARGATLGLCAWVN